MKTIRFYMITFTIMVSGYLSMAQTVNWRAMPNFKKNIIGISLGLDHSVSYGLSYGRSVKVAKLPVFVTAEFLMPSGEKKLDDFKSKVGGQIRLINYRGFQFSTRVQGVFRRYENDFVRMLNFGSDFAGVAGFYQSRWFIAAESGFDKAIVTHFKHSALYRAKYGNVVDGWYEPSTGGNFYYGIQTGFNFKSHSIYIKAGNVLSQDFKSKPLLPYYGQVGYTIIF